MTWTNALNYTFVCAVAQFVNKAFSIASTNWMSSVHTLCFSCHESDLCETWPNHQFIYFKTCIKYQTYSVHRLGVKVNGQTGRVGFCFARLLVLLGSGIWKPRFFFVCVFYSRGWELFVIAAYGNSLKKINYILFPFWWEIVNVP